MMLFAETTAFTAQDWTIIIGAIVVGINTIVGPILNWITNRKIDNNTDITKASITETSAKVDSTLKIVTDKADQSAVEAKQEAKQEAIKVASVALSEANRNTEKTVETLAEIKQTVNGRMDEMLKLAREAAYHEGFLKGQEEARKKS